MYTVCLHLISNIYIYIYNSVACCSKIMFIIIFLLSHYFNYSTYLSFTNSICLGLVTSTVWNAVKTRGNVCVCVRVRVHVCTHTCTRVEYWIFLVQSQATVSAVGYNIADCFNISSKVCFNDHLNVPPHAVQIVIVYWHVSKLVLA